MIKYWLRLSPDTFVWVKNGQGLVYNANNARRLRFKCTEQIKILVDELNLLENLYRILITEEELAKDEIKSFVNGIIEIEGGTLFPAKPDFNCPISFKPELRIRDDINFYKWRHNNGIGGNIMYNLNSLMFYINGSEYGSEYYYKQTIFPLKDTNILDENKIIDFALNSKKSSYLSEISLIGNIWEYPNYSRLITNLNESGFDVVVYCIDKDLLLHKEHYNQYMEDRKKVFLRILISDYNEAFRLFEIWHGANNCNLHYIFLIKNEFEYEQTLEFINKYNLNKVDIIPLYTKNNIQFFEDYIYISEDDLINSHLSKREIFARQALNIHSFGKLHILPNGDVYANCNDPMIGSIHDLPYNIIYKEMLEGYSWLRIRDKEPCNECIYQWLCSSPSNYELAIGIPNLCQVKRSL